MVLVAGCGDGGTPVPAELEPAAPLTQTVPVATAVPDDPAVRVVDADGRPLEGVLVEFQVQDGAGAVVAGSVTSDHQGFATSGTWTLGPVAGDQRLPVSVDDFLEVEFRAVATPGPPHEVVARDPREQLAYAGDPVPTAPSVQVRDAHGNGIPMMTVAWNVRGSAGGTVAPETQFTDIDGIAAVDYWRLGPAPGSQELQAVVDQLSPGAGAQTATLTAVAGPVPSGRALQDRPDDRGGPQIHLIYLVPLDGEDRRLDVDGTIAGSVASFHTWFMERSQGLGLRLDTFDGGVDVTYRRLHRTDAEIRAHGAFAMRALEAELEASGLLDPTKRYLLYYDGGSSWSCGGASWPPQIPGQVAALYLRGTPGGSSCGAVRFHGAHEFPGYWEFAGLHDLLHVLGFVSTSAPNHSSDHPAHVPFPDDLMYGGTDPWRLDETTSLDVMGEDYFGPYVPPGVPRLTGSPFVEEVDATRMLALPAPAREHMDSLAVQLERLPVHPPLEN